MNEPLESTIIYLDGPAERRQVVRQISALRQHMREFTASIPSEQWYEPRYDGLTLAAILGHLNFSDNMGLMLLKMAQLGLRPATSERMLKRVNRLTIFLFRRRLIQASLQGMAHNQNRIIDYVLSLPIDQMSKSVWNPARQHFTTIEKGLQEFFIHHWQHHLAQIEAVEGMTPSQRSDNI
ncbi:MAG: DinB family protein [Chloroflexota bacterium]